MTMIGRPKLRDKNEAPSPDELFCMAGVREYKQELHILDLCHEVHAEPKNKVPPQRLNYLQEPVKGVYSVQH